MSGYRKASSGSQSSGSKVNIHVNAATARATALVLALLVAGAAAAQDAEPPPNAAPPPVGILEALGRWLDDSKAKIDSQIKNTTDAARDAAKDAAEKAGQATTGIVVWPGSKVAQGRVRCAVAPNGAPDCTEAANALCRSKGYGPGKSLEINTAEKCPTWVWLSGRPAPEGTCKVENFVLQAACQ